MSRTGKDSWFYQLTLFGRRPTSPGFLVSSIFTISWRDLWSGHLDYLLPLLIEDLRFWLTNLSSLNDYNIRPKVSVEPLTMHPHRQ